MKKIVKIWENDSNFVDWAKSFSKDLRGEFKVQFDQTWPKVRTNNVDVIACFVLYWHIRTGVDEYMLEIMQPMTIGLLAHMADTAQAVKRDDLIEVINNMIFNIPRIRTEIINEIITGELNEEE
tara:strand:- start:2004 stop:2375 length:372 start_codon:yes stop_codon:yes gene_type:complete